MMKWISSFGGPFICTDHSTAERWLGTEGLSFETDLGVESDYELACRARDYAEVLADRFHTVLVLGDLPYEICWLELGAGDGMFIKWIGADSEEQVHCAIDDVLKQSFTPLSIRFSVERLPLIAFDSACQITELEDNQIDFNLPIGLYGVSFLNYAPNDSLWLNFIRLRQARL